MKLHRLELEGFGPFHERQTVDFDAFDADGLFLISGRTGAGKSSILDGVCYALYGTAPRYDGGDRGLRSDHSGPADPTEVQLEFTAGGDRWRVTRTPEYERPKARGEGTTLQRSAVLVEQLIGGEWIGRATKYREAAEILDGVVGLNRDQFQQVILLAQNRFAEFLLAGNDDRQALLRSLFGSRRYEDYEREFTERRRAAQQSLDADAASVNAQLAHAEALIESHGLGGAGSTDDAADASVERGTAERLEVAARSLPRAAYRADESVRIRDEAREAHDSALAVYGERSALRRRQDERATSRVALAVLDARIPTIESDRARLSQAVAAEALRAPIEAAARARGAADLAKATTESARAAWVAAGEHDAPSAALRKIDEALTGDLAVWVAAAEIERGIAELEAELEQRDGDVVAAEADLARLTDASAERAARIAALQPELEAAEKAAPASAPARAAQAEAQQRVAAGREAEALAESARSAEAAHLSAADRREAAASTVRDLLRRRLDGYAGELAGGLADAEPCPVCGSVEHPRPAPTADAPVTDELLADAEAGVERATGEVAAAAERARDARQSHQEAAARAGGETLEVLEAAATAAEKFVATAVAAEAALAERKRELRELWEAQTAAGIERDEIGVRLASLREERAARAQQLAADRLAVESARGDHPTVDERVAASRRRRDLARALADAADLSALREATALDSEADRDGRVDASPFETFADASDALLPPAERDSLAADIRVFDIALATERERLLALETELAGTPEELIDLTTVSAATTAARDRWNAAVEVAARDAHVAVELAGIVERAQTAHAESAEATAEFEVIAGLADAVAGRTDTRMDLETFVLAAELEEIVAAANLRLDTMSSGRYRLQHSDAVGKHRAASGLGLSVLDAYTGQSRPAKSLSGGETFLASLALALGLAEVVTARAGGVRLDTLFIDEGFGSLDDETLDLAMRTLDELRQGGRTVGLISHVAAMKEQLPAQLLVEAIPQGSSVIRQAAALAR